MTREEWNVRWLKVAEAILEKAEEAVRSAEPDLKALKMYTDFYWSQDAHELAARKIELAERKVNEGTQKRSFSDEETEEGLDALLGKGVGE